MVRAPRRLTVASLVIAVIFALSGSRSAMAQVSVTDIGTINGRASAGSGINHAGDVSGASYFSGSIGDLNGTPSAPFLTHGVLFRGGTLHDLGAIEGNPTCSPLGCQSEAFGVNDQDWVVGWTDNGGSGTLPVVWLPAAVPGGNSGINALPALSPVEGSAVIAVNQAGQMVGFSKHNGFIPRAVRWQLGAGGATLTDLGTLRADDGGSAIASGINDAGQIVGSASDESASPKGFLYLPAPAYGLPAGMNNLTASQPDASASAVSVNNHGEVAGVIDVFRPFVWLPAPAHGLPAGLSLLTLDRKLLAFIPTAISDGGLITGQAYVLTNPNTGAFVRVAAAWHNGEWTYLNDLLPNKSPWSLLSADAVCHSGKTTLITGLGILSGVTDVNGLTPVAHGYVLSLTCTGDLNGDGDVNQDDIAILTGQLGQSVPAGTGADLNGDGVVDSRDLTMLTAQIGDPCFTQSSSTSIVALSPASPAPEASQGALPRGGLSPLALQPAAGDGSASVPRPYDIATATAFPGRAPLATHRSPSGVGASPLAAAGPLTAWPLPYRGGTLQVSFSLAGAAAANTDVGVYDLTGRRVRTLTGGAHDGFQSLQWDGRDARGATVGNGIYFLRATSAGRSTQLKVVIVR